MAVKSPAVESDRNTTVPAATSGTAAATSTTPPQAIVTLLPETAVTIPTVSAPAAEVAIALSYLPLTPDDLTTSETANP